MAKVKASEKQTPSYMILRKAFRMYCDRNCYAYWYGAKGEVLTADKMNDLINTYYKEFYYKFSASELEKYKRYALGKIGLDCSGFITAITGKQGYSGKLYEDTVDKTTVENGKAGYLLWKPGHVGVDIGYGYQMGMGTMGDSIGITKIQDIGFLKSGAFAGYDYSEANNH